jgi:ABC-2 type transport system ATP-binding protein
VERPPLVLFLSIPGTLGCIAVSMIQVENLKKIFRVHRKEPGLRGSIKSLLKREWVEKHALKGVSMKIDGGEIVGLVGANGAGKTTLVKALAGIIHPTSGKADILGYVPWERKNGFRHQIALIMGQKAQLWWDLPAADCFLLLREIYQIQPQKFNDVLNYLAETLQVKDQLNIQIRRLSLGERMKMELIAALLHQPKVVFLDEPTIGLDLTAQRAIRDFLLQYRKLHHPAMIVTSHYMEDIESLCERIIIIREGEFVYDGPLSKIVSDYARYKIITARLNTDNGVTTTTALIDWPSELGEVLSVTEETVRLKALRERVPDAASSILHKFPIVDLNIEEEDIGTIIEAIMRKEHL